MTSFAQNTLDPITFSLGEASQHCIIHQHDDLFIAHEYLFQLDTPTRFYQSAIETFLFLLKGEVYVQQSHSQGIHSETAIKPHQGVWLNANTLNKVTLLTANAEVCLIRMKNTPLQKSENKLNKVSTGTVQSVTGRNHIKTWPLWQGENGQIAIELYPPHFQETLYYHKTATQYWLPLHGAFYIAKDKKPATPCPSLGTIIPKKIPRAAINHSADSISVLSIKTAEPSKGRVLLLSKKNH